MPPIPPPPGIAGASPSSEPPAYHALPVVIRRPATTPRILQSGPDDLRGVDDAGLEHVDNSSGLGI
jgi:hypothetical protein